jgi:peptidoglycan hydrolase-like protein with peptidoglycan-binding domain
MKKEYLKNTLLVSLLTFVMVFVIASKASAALTRQLDMGMSGVDVSSLQSFLAQDPSIYPQGLVTGYFGSLTAAAVSNFQRNNDLDIVGRVGPMTLAEINRQMALGGISGIGGGLTALSQAPIISNIGVAPSSTGANITWTTNENARGTVYYSTVWMPMVETPNDVVITGNVAVSDMIPRTFQNITLSGLQSGTTYYYVIYTKDVQGNTTITWPKTFRTM